MLEQDCSVHTGAEMDMNASVFFLFVWLELRATELQVGRENLMFEETCSVENERSCERVPVSGERGRDAGKLSELQTV